MQISDRTYNERLRDTSLRVALITALFNENITRALAKAAESTLLQLGVEKARILKLEIPGAWELPLAAKKIFSANLADAVIACGCVIRGDTGHYDIVANQSAHGLMQVSLEFAQPVMNAVLTVENLAQAEARARADATNKGAEAARSLIELANALAPL
ncbi:MAG: 6,7-dimethyl-8-ribityllumazine synthase [Spirochaetes bacterium]|nr:6,7-dimethyl-8-ribityllumazine synthase [Spirochaetota bacterium]